MTLKQLFENVQDHFPNIGWTRFVMDYNNAYKDFCSKTNILTKSADLSFSTSTTSYTLLTEFTDIDGEKVTNIKFLDSNGDEVAFEYTMKFSIEDGVLTFYDYKGSDIDSISNVTTIVVHYVYVPTELSSESDEPAIADEFHEAPLEKVLAKYYGLFKVDALDRGGNLVKITNINQSLFHESRYRQYVKDGWKKKHTYSLTNGSNPADQF